VRDLFWYKDEWYMSVPMKEKVYVNTENGWALPVKVKVTPEWFYKKAISVAPPDRLMIVIDHCLRK